MEGWLEVKRGWIWSQRYGIIVDGQFRYYNDQTLAQLKKCFILKDHSILQDRPNKTIKLLTLNTSTEVLKIRCDLHELWNTKLIQAKVAQMNINYIPLLQVQEQIRRREGNERNNLQQPNVPLEQQGNQQFGMRNQQIQQQQPQQQQQNYSINDDSGLQRSNQSQMSALSRSGVMRDQQQQNQPQAEPPKKGLLSRIFGAFQQAPLYSEDWVNELNSNPLMKRNIRSRIEDFMVAFTAQPNDFIESEECPFVRFNRLQERQLRSSLVSKKSLLPIRLTFSLILTLLIILDIFEWQKNQLIYTFCCLLGTIGVLSLKLDNSEKASSNCLIDCFTPSPLEINKTYNITMLLKALSKANPLLIIYESQKNKELMILDKNQQFQALYLLRFSGSSDSEFSIHVYSKNFQFINSIIDNFTVNFSRNTGIWDPHPQSFASRRICTYVNLLEAKKLERARDYQIYKSTTLHPLSDNLYTAKSIIFNNWELIYEIYSMLMMLHRLVLSSNGNIDLRTLWTWIILVFYCVCFMKASYKIECFFINSRRLRNELQKSIDQNYNRLQYVQQQNISSEMLIDSRDVRAQEFLNKSEVWAVMTFLFSASFFKGSEHVLPVLFIIALKPSFIKNRSQVGLFFKQAPRVIIYTVMGFFAAIYISLLFLVKIPIILLKIIKNYMRRPQANRIRSQQLRSNFQSQVSLQFTQARSFPDYQSLECGICLESYNSPNTLLFQCSNNHIFHKQCILNWVASGNFAATKKCPLCRVDLFTN